MTNYDELYGMSDVFDEFDYQLSIDVDYDKQFSVMRGESVRFPRTPTSHWEAVGPGSEPDMAFTTHPGGYVLSEPAVAKLKQLSGWSPACIKGPGKQKYSLMSITGRAGPVDPTRSKVRKDTESEDTELVGLYFRENFWDGSDIFGLKERSSFIFVTDAAKRVLEEICGKLTFTRLSSLSSHPLGMQILVEHQIEDGLTTTEWKWGSF